jgi:maltose alpha-D-glucosyltransferase/alpha-amylase
VDPDPRRPTVAGQQSDPRSLLQFVRAMVRLRAEHAALGADGRFTPLYAKAGQYPFVYLRALGKERILVAINPSGKTATGIIPSQGIRVEGAPLVGQRDTVTPHGGQLKIRLNPVSFALYRV